MKCSNTNWRHVLPGLVCLGGLTLQAAPIPKLYNTGVDDSKAILPPAAVDPHYTLTASADANDLGPDTFTLNPGFPVGPWLAEGPDSRWIAPNPAQGVGDNEGSYTYRTTFDLTGYDAAKASITGRWAVDNGGTDILLNGNSLGLANNGGFGAFTDFEIPAGSPFVSGVNTIEFIVSNAPSGINPTGFRAEMRGVVELPSEPPTIVLEPVGKSVLAGDDVAFTVDADGTPPLTYQWRRNDKDIDGATEATFSLAGVQASSEGNYTVLVKNGSGQKLSKAAKLLVLEPLPGLFDTGVGPDHAILEDAAVDPHYVLSVNPDGTAPDAIVEDSTLFPIVTGPWKANTDLSKWIGPRVETSGAAGGDYTYRMTFSLNGFDPSTAFLSGTWVSDNAGTAVILNGIVTGVTNPGNFDTLNPFTITSGFQNGDNVLEFKVNNASLGYTGLRVEGLKGGAKAVAAGTPPGITSDPLTQTVRAGDTVTLRVLAVGTDPLNYVWSFKGTPIPGATSASYTINPVAPSNQGDYTVRVSNTSGVANSKAATLTVAPSSELSIQMVTGLTIGGLVGKSVKIEAADSASDPFKVLSNLTLTADPTFYLDLPSTNKPARVYRVTPNP